MSTTTVLLCSILIATHGLKGSADPIADSVSFTADPGETNGDVHGESASASDDIDSDTKNNGLDSADRYFSARKTSGALRRLARPNLLRNGGFEDVPGPLHDQGLLPSEWVQIEPSSSQNADTYSTDGSYGLSPESYPHFPGVMAFEGIRWVAAWTAVPEMFGQCLSLPLEPSRSYRIQAALLQSQRADVDYPGGYHILLAEGSHYATATHVATLDPTTGSTEWEVRSAVFAAPADAASRSWVVFRPYSEVYAYPGIDGVTLEVEFNDGDIDNDGDVDLDDYVVFAGCLDGPGSPPAPALPDVTTEDCLAAFDFDLDADVDAMDFAAFQEVIAAP